MHKSAYISSKLSDEFNGTNYFNRICGMILLINQTLVAQIVVLHCNCNIFNTNATVRSSQVVFIHVNMY